MGAMSKMAKDVKHEEWKADIRRMASEQEELVRNNPKLRDLCDIFHSGMEDATRGRSECGGAGSRESGMSEAENELMLVQGAIPEAEDKRDKIKGQLDAMDASAPSLMRRRYEAFLERTIQNVEDLKERAKSLKKVVRADKMAASKDVPALDDKTLREKCENLHVKTGSVG